MTLENTNAPAPTPAPEPKTDSRRDFLSILGWSAVGGAATLALPYGSAAHAMAGSCAPPKGKLTSGLGSFSNPIAFKGDAAFKDGSYARTRKSASKLSSADLKKVDDAYKKMRALPSTDPRAFAHQANIHCWFCGMNTQIHGSWRFFPWHRAYLYFHEKILGKLIGDPNFALPYWDWNVDRAIPTLYRKDNLLNSTRNAACNSGSKTLSDQLVGKATMDRMLAGTSTAGFVGDANHGGNLEFGPHGGVHIWAEGDMSMLDTAGRDPLFYAHHNNIDRLWSVWAGMGGGRVNPSDSSWLNQSWTFYGPDEKWYTIKVADVIDSKKSLGFSWNQDPGEPVADDGQGEWVYEPGAEQSGGSGGSGYDADDLNLSEGATLDPNPRTYKAKLKPVHKQQLNDTAAPYSVRVQQIDVPTTNSAIVKLYAQDPSANENSASDDRPQYVGYMAVVARSAGSVPHSGKLNAALDLHPKVRKNIATGDEMALTSVPSNIGGKKPSSIRLAHGRIFGHSYKRK